MKKREFLPEHDSRFTNGTVQVYTGDGKGKTTAALGLALRAAGHGMRIYIGQFIKNDEYSEIRIIRERFPEITLEQYGRGCFIIREPEAEDIRAAQSGLEKLSSAMLSDKYDLVIADEINVAVKLGLLKTEDLITLCNNRPRHVELVLTGRGASAELIDAADLATCMQEVKHYYKAGIPARHGIEH